MANCQNTQTVLTHLQDVWMDQIGMTDASTTQDNSILPAPPVGGLSISQDRLDRIKIVRDSTTLIILPSGKNILVNMVFKISVGYTNLDTRQIQSRLLSRVCLFITPNANMAGYPTKHNVFIGKSLKDTFVSRNVPASDIIGLGDTKVSL